MIDDYHHGRDIVMTVMCPVTMIISIDDHDLVIVDEDHVFGDLDKVNSDHDHV